MPTIDSIVEYLKEYNLNREQQVSLFDSEVTTTTVEDYAPGGISVPFFINEFWTARQRQSSSIQEISYRACFKPQLPRFFIELLTQPTDLVYDPFSGRGTTPIEAALLGRQVIANDINPLSKILAEPRLSIPSLEEIKNRLLSIPFQEPPAQELDLSMFYHPQTESELLSLRENLKSKRDSGTEDKIDRWIRMVATNRLTGHSRGFFSVYTMPPNQAVSAERQIKINRKLNQKPEYRDIRAIIIKKSRQLMRNLSETQLNLLRQAAVEAVFLEKESFQTEEIPGESVALTVTSPPFLDVVQYSSDNWLRSWFNDIDMEKVEQKMTMASTLNEWSSAMGKVFKELYRITKPGGWVAFEVGEVKGGKINLEEAIVPLGAQCGFKCAGVIINRQEFTKTSNIWGVKNNKSGTNSNRIVLFNKH
ncbi:MAG: DNA methyltransferase [Bacillota bacterium]